MTDNSTARDARSRASRIREGIHNYLATLALIAEAWEKGDWRALGYSNWESYVDAEYGADRLRLPIEHRQKAVEELRLLGMSQRAIAATVGVSQEQVRRDLAQVTPNVSPEAKTSKVKGLDKKSYASTKPKATPKSKPQAEADAATSVAPVPEAKVEPPVPDPLVAIGHKPPQPDAVVEKKQLRATNQAKPEPLPGSTENNNAVDRSDPEVELRAWRKAFLKAIKQGKRPMSFTDTDVAEKADDECFEELSRLAASLADFVGRLESKRPKKVPPLRLVAS